MSDDPAVVADALDMIARYCDGDDIADITTAARLLRESAGTANQHATLSDERDQYWAGWTAAEARLSALTELCGFLIDACATHRIPVPLNSSLLDLAAEIAGGGVLTAAAVQHTPDSRLDDFDETGEMSTATVTDPDSDPPATRVVHCWEDGDRSTCMLPDGHDGPHEFTPDDQIVVRLAAPDSEGA